MERKDALAGGGAEGRSLLLRLPCCWALGAVTYPQNTESGSRGRKRPSGAGRVSVQTDSEGGERV